MLLIYSPENILLISSFFTITDKYAFIICT